eukprot:5012473-Lingulodinium_polyedra.AAC.1
MTGCVYAHARLRQCACLRTYAFARVFMGTRVKMRVYPTASVAMPRLRPRLNQEKAKTCVPRWQMGVDVDAVGMAAQ